MMNITFFILCCSTSHVHIIQIHLKDGQVNPPWDVYDETSQKNLRFIVTVLSVTDLQVKTGQKQSVLKDRSPIKGDNYLFLFCIIKLIRSPLKWKELRKRVHPNMHKIFSPLELPTPIISQSCTSLRYLWVIAVFRGEGVIF